jgi:hypothetical protein
VIVALLRYQELLREHALLVRRGDVPHHFERRRVIGALKLARAAQMVIRRLRARGGDPFEIADTRADAATAFEVMGNIAATLTARLEGTMGVRERSDVGAYAAG